MNSHAVFIHIHQGCFAGTGAIVRLPQCQWSKLDGYGKISQCITTTKHSKAKTVRIFLGIYCTILRNLFGTIFAQFVTIYKMYICGVCYLLKLTKLGWIWEFCHWSLDDESYCLRTVYKAWFLSSGGKWLIHGTKRHKDKAWNSLVE